MSYGLGAGRRCRWLYRCRRQWDSKFGGEIQEFAIYYSCRTVLFVMGISCRPDLLLARLFSSCTVAVTQTTSRPLLITTERHADQCGSALHSSPHLCPAARRARVRRPTYIQSETARPFRYIPRRIIQKTALHSHGYRIPPHSVDSTSLPRVARQQPLIPIAAPSPSRSPPRALRASFRALSPSTKSSQRLSSATLPPRRTSSKSTMRRPRRACCVSQPTAPSSPSRRCWR